MDYVFLAAVGIVMGLFGGLLGIGGSIVMIPALVVLFGENQHLYQAAAMICNFFVGASAVAIHHRARFLVGSVIKWLVPAAIAGVITGVAISNSSLFARRNSYLLARLFGAFMVYVVVYNVHRFWQKTRGVESFSAENIRYSPPLAAVCGLVTGLFAGLLGIGGGIICVPTQQLLLKMPLKRAIANSAALIAAIALVGATYKNLTLPEHGIELSESLRIVLPVIPGAVVGALAGGRLMHVLPGGIVRAAFIILAVLAAVKLLTVAPGH
jgi:uncharacterized membrane protein YfcA